MAFCVLRLTLCCLWYSTTVPSAEVMKFAFRSCQSFFFFLNLLAHSFDQQWKISCLKTSLSNSVCATHWSKKIAHCSFKIFVINRQKWLIGLKTLWQKIYPLVNQLKKSCHFKRTKTDGTNELCHSEMKPGIRHQFFTFIYTGVSPCSFTEPVCRAVHHM